MLDPPRLLTNQWTRDELAFVVGDFVIVSVVDSTATAVDSGDERSTQNVVEFTAQEDR